MNFIFFRRLPRKCVALDSKALQDSSVVTLVLQDTLAHQYQTHP